MTHEQHEQDRKRELERLYHESYGHILDLALADRRLLAQDGEGIAQSVASHLDTYDGPIETESFRQWIEDAVSEAAQRIAFFYGLKKECRKSIRSCIWRALDKDVDLKDHTNTAYVIDQIESNVWVWVWHHLDDLLVPGTAKLLTRLVAQTKYQILSWRKGRLRDNDKFDREAKPDCFGTEPHQVVGRDLLYFDPTQDENEDGDDRPVHRPKGRHKQSPSDSLLAMKSGRPMLFCQSCKCLQIISPDPPSEHDSLKLRCGHERPAALAAVA
jgi:hypothetical protein